MSPRIAMLLLLGCCVGCGSPSSPPAAVVSPSPPPAAAPAPPASGAAVTIVLGASTLTTTAYAPNPVTVTAGGTVTWTNGDTLTHTSNADGAAWNSGPIAPGRSFSHTFATAGTFPYHCTLHPGMIGTVTVQ